MEAKLKRTKRASGFTLIEVMLGIFVLTLTVLMFAAMFPTAQISRIKAAHMTYAVSLAQQTLEEKRAAGYAGLLADTSEVSVPPDLPGGQQVTTVTQYAPNIKKVEVTITWSGYRQVGGSTTLVTLISDSS